MQTINTVLQKGLTTLASISDAPAIDVERLLLYVLEQHDASWLYAHAEEELPADQTARLETLIAERVAGRPLAYILGEAEFYSRSFYVNEHVLIPRPETENLVDATLDMLSSPQVLPRPTSPARRLPQTSRRSAGDPPGESPAADETFTIADIGTGSGCITISLALELARKFKAQNSKFKFVATDISEKALVVARKNAERYGVSEHIEFLVGDMLQPLAERNIDLIVSNPPYVPSAEVARAGAAADTRGLTFEPQIALDGGHDGQKFVEQIKTAGIPYVMETVGGKTILDFAR